MSARNAGKPDDILKTHCDALQYVAIRQILSQRRLHFVGLACLNGDSSMIERLQRALAHIEELSPEAQQDLAQQIEELTAPLQDVPALQTLPPEGDVPASVRVALALGGAWSDLQGDDEFAALDRIRHEAAPTAPMDEQLTWLDNDGDADA